MFVNLKQKNRFQFFKSTEDPITKEIIYDEPAGDGYVTLRPKEPFYKALMAAREPGKAEWVHDKVTRRMQRERPLFKDQTMAEIQKDTEDMWDYVIVGFEGFKDRETGQVIECTRENKLLLIELPVFQRFCERCLVLMAEASIQEKEAETKNSLPGSSSTMTSHDPGAKKKTERS